MSLPTRRIDAKNWLMTANSSLQINGNGFTSGFPHDYQILEKFLLTLPLGQSV
jgi:hypothetical protein